jgi:hypothetical protein
MSPERLLMLMPGRILVSSRYVARRVRVLVCPVDFVNEISW